MEDFKTAFILLSCQIGFGVLFIVWLTDRLEKRLDRIVAKLEAAQPLGSSRPEGIMSKSVQYRVDVSYTEGGKIKRETVDVWIDDGRFNEDRAKEAARERVSHFTRSNIHAGTARRG